jgi:hypothetical protein
MALGSRSVSESALVLDFASASDSATDSVPASGSLSELRWAPQPDSIPQCPSQQARFDFVDCALRYGPV